MTELIFHVHYKTYKIKYLRYGNFYGREPHPWHIEIPRTATESELPLQHMLQLQQHRSFNPLHQAGAATWAAIETTFDP